MNTCTGNHTWGRCDRDDCDFARPTPRWLVERAEARRRLQAVEGPMLARLAREAAELRRRLREQDQTELPF